ncbi:hypothetical protein [Arthrobacter sp. M4]|uniref:hypothetical protein n=1 Tax=Arthrobacter sp. M4 TaxID=218160 RepID=UPI001CDC18FA|nr:hypothetical protein [Arthrobacter sp. M4]MCA4134949.1 hypothetical protein [Arthrobacter sp. M4]
MATIRVETSIIIPCGRAEVYYLTAIRKVHYLNTEREVPLPEFVDFVQDRSWTELLNTSSMAASYSYVVYPVADSTRMTVTADITPRGFGRLFPGMTAGSIKKREEARVADIRKAVMSHLNGGARLAETGREQTQ